MNAYFSEDTSAKTVLARLAQCQDPRLRAIMTAAITHSHAFVKDGEAWTAAFDIVLVKHAAS